MKVLQQWLTAPSWFNSALESGSRTSRRTLILDKAAYSEYVRRYSASALDLPRIIRNELKVLSRNDAKVLWKIISSGDGAYRVLYAVVDKATTDKIAGKWCLLIPETWLLYKLLQTNTLYCVQSDTQYWAWLAKDSTLHTTAVGGLMTNPRFFLDALGQSKVQAVAENLSIRNEAVSLNKIIHWRDLPGILCFARPASSGISVPWRKFMFAVAAVTCVYMAGTSAYLSWQENRLRDNVAQLQQAASKLFDRQQTLENLARTQADYSLLFDRYPQVNSTIATIIQQIPDNVVLENIAMSGALLQLSGSADSATEVLASLNVGAKWREVKFDSNVRRNKGREFFTISLVIPQVQTVGEGM